MHKSMRQNASLIAEREFDQVDEGFSARLAQATATLALAALGAAPQRAGFRITLSGNLGAGKTTWVREFLRACGIRGRVKSPSFSVVETYEHEGLVFHHLDFYRQANPAAWQGGGLRDLLTERAIVLIEWPENAQGLPPAHIELSLTWNHEADAASPRKINFRFYDRGDGVKVQPQLAQWDQWVQKTGRLP